MPCQDDKKPEAAAAAEPRRLVIWGASGHASVVADIIRLCGEFEIEGLLDDVQPGRRGEKVGRSHVLGGREQLPGLRQAGVRHAIVGFGDCRARLEAGEWLKSRGFTLVRAIHPSATVAGDVEIGDGTAVMAGSVVNPGTRIGASVIVNTGATIDHDCVIGDGAHVCPGVHLGGWVSVGEASWVGIGTTIKDRIRVGADVLIGAGSVVVRDLEDGVQAYGVPARVVSQAATR